MTYAVIVIRGGEELVFKHIGFFLAEPGRVKIRTDDWRGHSVEWITITEVEGLIIHEEE